jgi:hypothetical protein
LTVSVVVVVVVAEAAERQSCSKVLGNAHFTKPYIPPDPNHKVHSGPTQVMKVRLLIAKAAARWPRAVRGTLVPRLLFLLEALTNVEFLEEMCNSPDLFAGVRSPVSKEVCQVLILDELLNMIPQAEIKRTGTAFMVGEPSKLRNRFILWPRQLNEEYRQRYGFDIWIPALWEVQAIAARKCGLTFFTQGWEGGEAMLSIASN